MGKKWFLLFVLSVVLQVTFAEKKSYLTKKIDGNTPKIDGLMEEGIWETVEWAGGFVQREPYENQLPSQNTQFKILYDDNNLYVAIRAFDTAPDSIEQRMSRRDGFAGDWVEINIDSYHDLRTAFSFTATAAGVKGDEAITENGDSWDSSWDPIWYMGTSIDALGWVAEMKIPFSQLRFGNEENYTWGLQVNRRYFRKQEMSSWQFISPNAPGWVHLFGELQGIKGIQPKKQKDIIPYIVTGFEKYEKDEENPFLEKGKGTRLSAGVDGKIGITNDLTLDFTINPDFGQVESDPSVVNLSAFETRYGEKRPFFIEGRNIMNYQLTFGGTAISNDNLFYSRRIGRPPQYYPDNEAIEFVKQPINTTILGALKLTGKTQKGWSIGILESVTSKEKAETIDTLGKHDYKEVEPLTNYFITRIQKDLNNSNTQIGGMVTVTNRDLSNPSLNWLHKSAYTAAIDFSHQWKDKTYYFTFRGAYSQVNGSEEAILRAQTSPARYYQRPDAKHVEVDSSLTSLNGTSGFINFGRAGNSKIMYTIWLTWRSPGFELNDLGYIYRGDEIQEIFWVGYRKREPFCIFRNLNANFNQWYGWNFGGEKLYRGTNIDMSWQYKNYWGQGFNVSYDGESMTQSALRGGPSALVPPYWFLNFNINSDQRKKISGGLNLNYNWNIEKFSYNNNYNFWVDIRISNTFQLTVSPSVSFNYDELAYVNNIELNDGSIKYLRGQMDQTETSLTMRFTYNITPDFTIQYYGQPFLSAGSYINFKYISNSRADNFDDRYVNINEMAYILDNGNNIYYVDEGLDGINDYEFDNPNFNFFEFRSNMVARWEYNPGSTVYVVWTQGRSGNTSKGIYNFSNDINELFDVFPNNIFLVKLSYRIGW